MKTELNTLGQSHSVLAKYRGYIKSLNKVFYNNNRSVLVNRMLLEVFSKNINNNK